MRWLSLFLAMLPTASLAAECSVASGPNTTALIELYTSEGCSSCPPADRWLSSFVNAPGTRRVVPIAFHVSYWDYIGWKDRFADERYTQRQRALAKAAGARMVYTPQVIFAGRDFRAWTDESAISRAIDATNRQAARAQLELVPRVTPEGGIAGVAAARTLPALKADDLALFVALTQDGLSSEVTAGENRGEKLEHNFVVRDLAVIRHVERQSPPLLRAMFTFKPRTDWNLDKMAVVTFVQNLRTGEVLQALAASICR